MRSIEGNNDLKTNLRQLMHDLESHPSYLKKKNPSLSNETFDIFIITKESNESFRMPKVGHLKIKVKRLDPHQLSKHASNVDNLVERILIVNKSEKTAGIVSPQKPSENFSLTVQIKPEKKNVPQEMVEMHLKTHSITEQELEFINQAILSVRSQMQTYTPVEATTNKPEGFQIDGSYKNRGHSTPRAAFQRTPENEDRPASERKKRVEKTSKSNRIEQNEKSQKKLAKTREELEIRFQKKKKSVQKKKEAHKEQIEDSIKNEHLQF